MHPKLQETLSKYSTIILVGWGTGGHVQPIVSIISSFEKELSEWNEDWGMVREISETPIPLSTTKQVDIPLFQGGIPKFLWIWGKDSQEEQATRENNVEFMTIPTFKISTTRSPKILLYPFVLLRWILEARKILYSVISTEARYERNGDSQYTHCGWILLDTWKRFLDFGYRLRSKWQSQPTSKAVNQQVCVFSKGWPWSVAVGIAAWSLGIPLYIHESDTIPGRSNRILGKIAMRIFLGFDSAKKYFNPEKCEVIWQILSRVFEKRMVLFPSWGVSRETGRGGIFWKTSKKHLLVICGSQWARTIFEELLENLETILKDHEMILILGKLNTNMRMDFENSLSFRRGLGWGSIQLLDWISQEDLAYLILDTDIAITRGSATTLAELTAFNTPVSNITRLQESNNPTLKHSNTPTLIIIPLPYAADNHQYWNAREYEKLWHTLLEQKNIHLLKETIQKIWQNSPHSNT